MIQTKCIFFFFLVQQVMKCWLLGQQRLRTLSVNQCSQSIIGCRKRLFPRKSQVDCRLFCWGIEPRSILASRYGLHVSTCIKALFPWEAVLILSKVALRFEAWTDLAPELDLIQQLTTVVEWWVKSLPIYITAEKHMTWIWQQKGMMDIPAALLCCSSASKK